MASLLTTLLNALDNLQMAKYVTVASVGLLCYDYLITLPEEIHLVWPSAWYAPKFLFMLNRYLAFLDPIWLMYTLLIGGDLSYCETSLKALGHIASYGIVIAELILMLRTWAIYGGSRSITILLLILFIADIIVPAVVAHIYFIGFSAIQSPFPTIHGCLFNLKRRVIVWDIVLVIINESILLGLLLKKTMGYAKMPGKTIMAGMYRDGVIYFIAILCTSIADLVGILVAPIEINMFLIVTQRVLHSCLCSRVLLHIRSNYSDNPFFSTRAGAPFTEFTSGVPAFRSEINRGTGVIPTSTLTFSGFGSGYTDTTDFSADCLSSPENTVEPEYALRDLSMSNSNVNDIEPNSTHV